MTNVKTMLGVAALAACSILPGVAIAADPPVTGEVLGKLHQANQKEIQMGKVAQKSGTSKAVKDFGAMLVKDHSAADRKVVSLAKKEKIDLGSASPPAGSEMAEMAKEADFDAKFAQDMLDDHRKDVAEATAARDATTDSKLKELLAGLIPTLQKHEEAAQKLVNDHPKKASGDDRMNGAH